MNAMNQKHYMDKSDCKEIAISIAKNNQKSFINFNIRNNNIITWNSQFHVAILSQNDYCSDFWPKKDLVIAVSTNVLETNKKLDKKFMRVSLYQLIIIIYSIYVSEYLRYTLFISELWSANDIQWRTKVL